MTARMRAHGTAAWEWHAALQLADDVLSRPPVLPHIRRPEPTGRRVARFALPLDLCRPQNRTRHAPPWALGRLKRDVVLALYTQGAREQPEPLPGRPQVLVLRLSSVEPDRFADGAKAAIDTLCRIRGRATHRFGYLEDDAPRCIDLEQWWEPAPPRRGAVVIEIRTGMRP